MRDVLEVPDRNPAIMAFFMGHLHHETGGFKRDTESLNYSVQGLISTFSYYRNRPEEAQQDGRTPEKKADQQTIANKVYWDKNRGSRYKLGNTEWGDGWKYRGRGSIQVTGKTNYRDFFFWKGVPEDSAPELLAGVYYWDSGVWYFDKRGIWEHCNEVTEGAIKQTTRMINGGLNGLADRRNKIRYYYELLTK